MRRWITALLSQLTEIVVYPVVERERLWLVAVDNDGWQQRIVEILYWLGQNVTILVVMRIVVVVGCKEFLKFRRNERFRRSRRIEESKISEIVRNNTFAIFKSTYRKALIRFISGEYVLCGDFGKFASGESENFNLRGCTILSGDDWRSTLEFMSGESKSLLSVSIAGEFTLKALWNWMFVSNLRVCCTPLLTTFCRRASGYDVFEYFVDVKLC